jgi:hypothetical protein
MAPPGATPKPPVWKIMGIPSNALHFRAPRYEEHWLDYIQKRDKFINTASLTLTPAQKQALRQREQNAKKWTTIPSSRLVIYTLNNSGHIVDLKSHAKSSNDLLRDHAPWSRRYLPALAQWDVCDGYPCPPEVTMGRAVRTKISLPMELEEEYDQWRQDYEDNDEYHHGLDVAFHPLEQGFWDVYQNKYSPSLRPEDLLSVRPIEVPVHRAPPETPPLSPDHVPVNMDMDVDAPPVVHPSQPVFETPPPSPPLTPSPQPPPSPRPLPPTQVPSDDRVAPSHHSTPLPGLLRLLSFSALY